MCSVAGRVAPAIWVFSTSGFHHFCATKPVSSEASKAERGQMWRPWFYPGLVAHSFFWLSESLVVALMIREFDSLHLAVDDFMGSGMPSQAQRTEATERPQDICLL